MAPCCIDLAESEALCRSPADNKLGLVGAVEVGRCRRRKDAVGAEERPTAQLLTVRRVKGVRLLVQRTAEHVGSTRL
jgi:hypothetical protein